MYQTYRSNYTYVPVHRSYKCKTTSTALIRLTNVGKVINCIQSRPVTILWMTESVQIVLKGLVEADRSVLSAKNHCIGGTGSMLTKDLQRKSPWKGFNLFFIVFIYSDFFSTAKTLHTSNFIEEKFLGSAHGNFNMQHTYIHVCTSSSSSSSETRSQSRLDYVWLVFVCGTRSFPMIAWKWTSLHMHMVHHYDF